MIAEGAVVADVGINVLEDGTLCGDVDYENVREKVSHITPVPGGSKENVTTSVLASHVLRAARIGQNEHGTTQRVTPPLCRTQYKWAKNSYNR